MARAFDREALDRAAGEFAAVVRAHVLDRVQLAVDVEHRDRGVAVVAQRDVRAHLGAAAEQPAQ